MSSTPRILAGLSRQSLQTVAALVGALLLSISGCAATPYHYGRFHPDRPDGVDIQPIVVEQGEPNKVLDKIGWVVGAPARLLTLNKNVNNHDISPETLEKLRLYLERNDLTDVYVAVDVYDPKDQWRRLRENDTMSPVWRYSFGTINWLGYTIFPNRIFGGDRYNAFTNTLNLSSDVPASVLEEAAYAKDIHSQRNPGLYASLVNDMPVLVVYRQSKATSDLLGYARTHDDWAIEKQTYQVMYPQIGFGVIGPAGSFVPVVGPYIDIGGAVAGHVVGRTIAAVRESKRPKPEPSTEPAPPVLLPVPAGQNATELGTVIIADMEEAPRPSNEDKSGLGGGTIVPATFEAAARRVSNR